MSVVPEEYLAFARMNKHSIVKTTVNKNSESRDKSTCSNGNIRKKNLIRFVGALNELQIVCDIVVMVVLSVVLNDHPRKRRQKKQQQQLME